MAYVFAGEYLDSAEDATTGKPIPGVGFTVLLAGTSTKATLYTDRTKATTAPNPSAATVEGNIQFFAAPGRYDLVVNGRTIGPVTVYPDVADVEDVTTLLDQLSAKAPTSYVDIQDAAMLSSSHTYTDAETTRAQAAENANATAISSEITNRTTADGTTLATATGRAAAFALVFGG